MYHVPERARILKPETRRKPHTRNSNKTPCQKEQTSFFLLFLNCVMYMLQHCVCLVLLPDSDCHDAIDASTYLQKQSVLVLSFCSWLLPCILLAMPR